MAAITICSDFGAQKIKSDTVSTLSLHDALPILTVGPQRRLSKEELMLLNCGVGEDS